jgi:hypothetical protein
MPEPTIVKSLNVASPRSTTSLSCSEKSADCMVAKSNSSAAYETSPSWTAPMPSIDRPRTKSSSTPSSLPRLVSAIGMVKVDSPTRPLLRIVRKVTDRSAS